MMRTLRRLMLIALVTLLAACAETTDIPVEQVFPGTVGTFLRTAGPFTDAETGTEVATYAGPQGEVTLNVRYVGAENVAYALSELPVGAANVAASPELGPRDGLTFTYAEAYHAAWGNGDWVFVLNAPTPEARQAFLAGYGF